ncbi:hypothetical protein [Pseudomonas atacamensis]|uniref:hypothetical protein n=1 Tax=Pseudomonas atacamensis TaxID=2565368 RepID=UPI0021D86B0B|nr:hypothetical protein [Pseudomonas atacamensis]
MVGSQPDVPERDKDEYLVTPGLQPGAVHTNAAPPQTSEESGGTNWLKLAASVQHTKELIVIGAAASILLWMMYILHRFIDSLVTLFTRASETYSAPIAVVKTMDWHVLGLGVSMIVGISAISIILMKSVFGTNSQKTTDGLNLKDLPVGEFLNSVKDWFKR